VDELACGTIKEVEAEEFGAFAQRSEFAGSVEMIVSGGSRVVVGEVRGHHLV
jgi:hypothetical protein